MNERDIKRNLNKTVLFTNKRMYIKKVKYTLSGVTIRLKDGKFFYQAELLDKNKNSVLICRLDDVEEAI